VKEINWPKVLAEHIPNESLCLAPGFKVTRRRGPCPMCGGKDRFLFDNKNEDGMWWCNFCKGGNGFQLLQKACGFSAKEIFQILNDGGQTVPRIDRAQVQQKPELSEQDREHNAQRLRRTWSTSKPLKNSTALTYLKKRVRNLRVDLIGQDLRAHRMKYFELDVQTNQAISKGEFPVLVARAQSALGEAITIHRTYLDQRSASKADVESPKKLMKGVNRLDGAAVRLSAQKSTVLAVCEGIETGLAILSAHGEKMEVWSLLFAHNLSVADIPLNEFTEIHIYADHDAFDKNTGVRPGQAAAQKLKHSLEQEIEKQKIALRVKIHTPAIESEDWLDVWNRGEDIPT
jgi:putative DNA primase/helicase